MMHELAYATQLRHARLDRRQPRRPAARLGHRSVPDRPLPDDADACSSSSARAASAPGGVNFDAKVRRESFEPVDLFHAHIGGMDAFAHGLKIAAAIRKDGVLKDFVKQRYASWDTGIGAEIESGQGEVRGAGRVHAREGRRRQERVGAAGDAGEHREPVFKVVRQGDVRQGIRSKPARGFASLHPWLLSIVPPGLQLLEPRSGV